MTVPAKQMAAKMKRESSHDSVPSNELSAEALLTSHQVSDLLQVNPSSVNNWVREGRLPAFRTPGGHRRIKAADLASFLSAHKMPIPKGLAFAQRKRVLLVDDDMRQLTAFARLLETNTDQLELKLVGNGIDAIMAVGTFEPHLIVMDLFMPEVDGLEVCRRLRANPETADIEVIIATGQYSERLREDALAAGAQECVEKPLEPKLIFDALGLEMGRVRDRR